MQPFPIWRAGAYKKVDWYKKFLIQEIYENQTKELGGEELDERGSYRQNFFRAFFFATAKVGSKTAMIFFHREDIFLSRAQFTQRKCIPNIPAVFWKLRDSGMLHVK